MRHDSADPRPPRRHRLGRRASATVLAVPTLLVGATACAGDADADDDAGAEGTGAAAGQFEATAEYLQHAVEQSTSEGYRVEIGFSPTGEDDLSGVALMSGEVDGDSYHFARDMGSMIEQMGGSVPPEMTSGDLTMEVAGDPEKLYLRAPILANLASELAGGASGLAEMGDGWGYVDVAALGEQAPTGLPSLVGTQGLDPRAVLDLVEGAEDVQDLGTSEVRGDAVHGLSAKVSMAELVEASGEDPGVFAQGGARGERSDEAVADMYETPTSIDVWIGDDGYLRRLEYGWSATERTELAGEDPDEVPDLGFGDIRYTMDMYDYGATVEFEPPADAVDMTDAYAALAQG